MLCESPILIRIGVITEKNFSGHNYMYLTGHLEFSIDSAIQWKDPANAPNLTLLVLSYFFSLVSTTVAN